VAPLTNIRLAGKNLPGTNTLSAASLMKKKKFLTLTQEVTKCFYQDVRFHLILSAVLAQW
jgi:hypothetical protein